MDEPLNTTPSIDQPVSRALPSSNTSLVCGILSIVTAPTIFPAIALGVISIISANGYKNAGGSVQNVRAGKICGIVGLVFTALCMLIFACMMVFVIVIGNMTTSSASSDIPVNNSQDLFMEDEVIDDICVDVIDPFLNSIASQDDERMSEIADVLDDSFSELVNQYGFDLTLEECGIDPLEVAKKISKNFYFYTDLHAGSFDGQTAMIDYNIVTRDPKYIVNEFSLDLEEIAGSVNDGTIDASEAIPMIGEAFTICVDNAKLGQEILYVFVDRTRTGWAFTDDQKEELLDYLFGLDADRDAFSRGGDFLKGIMK